MAPPVKKEDPFAPKPNKFMPYIACGLLGLGGFWFIYKVNPAGIVREEWPEEKKERLEYERNEMMKKREEENKKKALEARMRRAH